jgi:NADPH2 dehydrogenase
MEVLKPYTLNKITLKNRIVMPPMCMYQAKDGFVNLFHVSHYSTRAMGNVGFIIMEATGVTPEGRITDRDLGIYRDEHIAGLKQIVDEVHRYGAKIGIQLGHAGRKSETIGLTHLAPSALAFSADYLTPKAMSLQDIKNVIEAFKQAAIRADQAGFDAIELHGAHGYLINQFMSPLANQRSDEYGGSLENRGRFLREIVDAVSTVWPKDKWFIVRVSAEEYDPQGNHPQEVAQILEPIKASLDLIHVSSGGTAPRAIAFHPLYQVGFAKTIKAILNMPVIAVGLINSPEEVESVLKEVDLVAMGRELLRNPNWVNGVLAADDKLDAVFKPYMRGFRR